MYPTRLNLMSKEKQGHITHMHIMGFVQNSIAMLFIIIAIFSIFTILSHVFLQSYLAEVTLQSIRTQNPTRAINAHVTDINTTIGRAHAIQTQYHSWTPYLGLIINTIPSTVFVDSIQFSHSEQLLKLSGTARSRESLLELKSHLEALEEIDIVQIPLNDLTKHEHISFSLSIPFAF